MIIPKEKIRAPNNKIRDPTLSNILIFNIIKFNLTFKKRKPIIRKIDDARNNLLGNFKASSVIKLPTSKGKVTI